MLNLYVSALEAQHNILEREIAHIIEQRADAEAKVQRLDDELSEKEAALNRIREYAVNDYHQIKQMLQEREYPCPYCLVRHGAVHGLTPIASEADNNLFYCHACKQECSTPEPIGN